MDREYGDKKTQRIEAVTFGEAMAKRRLLNQDDMRFAFNPTEYKSMKDTVPDHRRDTVCPACHFPRGEHGWIRMDWPVGHPLFGKAIQCPRCGT